MNEIVYPFAGGLILLIVFMVIYLISKKNFWLYPAMVFGLISILSIGSEIFMDMLGIGTRFWAMIAVIAFIAVFIGLILMFMKLEDKIGRRKATLWTTIWTTLFCIAGICIFAIYSYFI